MKTQTYVDDELMAADDKQSALIKTSRLDEIGEHAGMPTKGWTFSWEDKSDVALGVGEEDVGEANVLGILWVPKTDTFKFTVMLVLSKGAPDIYISTI